MPAVSWAREASPKKNVLSGSRIPSCASREIVLGPQQRSGGFVTAVVRGQRAGVHHTEQSPLARGGGRVPLTVHRRLGDPQGFAPESEIEGLVCHRSQNVSAQGASPARAASFTAVLKRWRATACSLLSKAIQPDT
ncbi:hypothetical protein SFUMM280S_01616 [Streptomyces fumanus]